MVVVPSITNQSTNINNVVNKISSHIPSHNFVFAIPNASINASSQNIFGGIIHSNAMGLLSMVFSFLFPLIIIIIILYLMIGYITNSKGIKESSSQYIRDFLFVVIFASIVNAFGFNIFYNILHIGYFFTQDFKMYNTISTTFISIWSVTVLLKLFILSIEHIIVGLISGPGINLIFAGLSASLQVGVTALISLLNTIITFSGDGFKITWIVLFLLSFAQLISITYLLPIGIVFIAIKPTKTIGASFIGVGIGLGFIFPIVTYIFTSVAFYIKNNFVIQTKLGPMTITQIGHQGITINSSHLLYALTTFVPGLGNILYIILFFQNMVIYVLFYFMIGTLIPGLSILMTIISITGISTYFGGSGSLPRIRI